MAVYLFVYGTLKRGQRNNRLLGGQELVGPARTLPRYRLYDTGSYPCLVEDHNDGVAVAGEIYRIAESCLPLLDRLEDVPRLFRRVPIAVEGFGEPVFAYLYNGDVSRFMDCGSEWPVSPRR